VDPYILRQYKYDPIGELNFNRLGVRSVKRDLDPVQFLVYRSQETSNNHQATATDSIELELLVPSDIGARLISL
jgi:hypothetical protein